MKKWNKAHRTFRRSGLFLLGLLFAANVLIAQAQRVALEVSPSGEMGWWIYDKGKDGQHLGYDHTSLAFTGGLETRLLIRVGEKWMVGAEYAFRALVDHDMTRSESPRGNLLEYDIASGSSVNISRLGLEAEYRLMQRAGFAVSPYFKSGLFAIQTIHPEADNFGRKTWWEMGVNYQFSLGRGVSFLLKPRYNTMRIQPQVPKHPGEKHRLYGLGLGLGLRIFLL